MKKEEMEALTNSMQEKLGKENSALIADDLGKLLSDNVQMNSEITNRDSQIEKLKQDKENLITTNGNLLQQVAMGEESSLVHKPNIEKEEKPKVSLKSAFDSKGNFIKNIEK